MMKHLGIAAAICLLLSGAANAQTAMMIMGTEDYDRIADVRRGDDVTSLLGFMRAAQSRRAPNAAEIVSQLANYERDAKSARQQIIVLSGRFVHTVSETYYLPSDARPGTLTQISNGALPLSTVLALLAETPGDAVLALATDAEDGAFGDLMSVGVGDLDLPQGVTLLEGEPRDMTRALSSLLREPGRRIGVEAGRNNLRVSGYLRRDQVLVAAAPAPAPRDTDTTTSTNQSNASRIADLLAWRQADRANTAEAYEGYIAANPTGQFVRMAESRLKALTDTPEARAERAEQRLDLNRQQRREIQRALTLLDYNTRGIDGIFGRGTRTAIGAWQRDNGIPVSGFVDEAQLRQLDTQARRRAAQLEAEAEARREAKAALDRAFWEETGAVGDAAGSRAYLERFPDGEYSDIARQRLGVLEREKRQQANARDRQLWDEASAQDTRQAYQDYLDIAPSGLFRDEAEDRIAQFDFLSSDAVEAARNEENALRMRPNTRRLVESRLDRFGLEPGPVDGNFTQETRRAIRRYQEARDFPQTGFLTQASLVRILADGAGALFQQ